MLRTDQKRKKENKLGKGELKKRRKEMLEDLRWNMAERRKRWKKVGGKTAQIMSCQL